MKGCTEQPLPFRCQAWEWSLGQQSLPGGAEVKVSPGNAEQNWVLEAVQGDPGRGPEAVGQGQPWSFPLSWVAAARMLLRSGASPGGRQRPALGTW